MPAAATYTVSPSGDDSRADGSPERPFHTIQRCAEILEPGDVCEVSPGIYRETIRPRRSDAGDAPITFRARAGGSVVVTGTDLVPGPWEAASPADVPHAGHRAGGFGTGAERGLILRAPVVGGPATPFPQVFVNGGLVDQGVWPPSPPSTPLTRRRAVAGKGTKHGEIHDDALTQPEGFWVGGRVHVTGGLEWGSHTGVVTSSEPGVVRFAASMPDHRADSLGAREGNRYRISGVLAGVNRPGTWHYDPTARVMWLWPDDPDRMVVEIKTRDVAFDLSGRSDIVVTGFVVHAATALTDQASRAVTIEDTHFRYVSHVPLTKADGEHERAATGVIIDGEGTSLRRSTVTHAAANGVVVRGRHNEVVDCVISETNYEGIELAAGVLIENRLDRGHTGCAAVVTNNTIFDTGDVGILLFTWPCWPPRRERYPQHDNRVAYNDVFNTLALAQDHGAIEACNNIDLTGTSIDHNWVHDGLAKGDRHHIGACAGVGIYLDHSCANAEVHHNVAWAHGMDGLRLNGSIEPVAEAPGHQVFNNTVGGGQRWSLGIFLAKTMEGTVVERNHFAGEVQLAPGAESRDNVTLPEPGFLHPSTDVSDERGGGAYAEGEWKPGSSLPRAGLTIVDDAPAPEGFAYEGGWDHRSGQVGPEDPQFLGGVFGPGLAHPYAGTVSGSSETGAEAALRFTGSGVVLHVLTGPDGGIVEARLDDGEPIEIDTFLEAPLGDQLAWGLRDLDAGPHVLRLTVKGEGSPRSTGREVRIDRAVVIP